MANATLQQILSAQNTYITNGEAARSRTEGKLDAALDALSSLATRTYSYKHEDFAVKTLETVYSEIITSESALADTSAVGFTALLKTGDTLPVGGNRLFINGTEELTDYTFTGTGAELVNVWYFGTPHVRLPEAQNTQLVTVILRQRTSIFDASSDTVGCSFVSQSYYCYVPTVIFDVCRAYSPKAVNTVYQTGLSTFIVTGESENHITNNVFITNAESVTVTVNYQSHITWLHDAYHTFIFPELKTITINSGADGFIANRGENTPVVIEMPVLERVVCNSNRAFAPTGATTITLPESVVLLSGKIFGYTYHINLECKNAEFQASNWCTSAPAMFTMCGDWGASINIATAAASWTMAQFMDLLMNKLRDMTLTEETRTLNIPSAILTDLSNDADGAAAITAATQKGWTVTA